MRNELAKLKGLKVGTARTSQESWHSDVLHKVNQQMEDGLDARRLHALADFIEGLRLAPILRTKGWAEGPLMQTSYVHGATPVKGYLLRASGDKGLGLVEFEAGQTGAVGYWLSGYGVICWGWGEAMGMAAVAGNGMVNQLQQVLTAEPVWERKFSDYTITKVTTAHVAQAIRYFIECQDAVVAWGKVADEQDVAGDAPRNVTPMTGTTVRELPKPKLTGGEQWKTLMMAERYGELVTLCEGEERKLQERIDTLLAEQKTWAKRRKSAQVMLGD